MKDFQISARITFKDFLVVDENVTCSEKVSDAVITRKLFNSHTGEQPDAEKKSEQTILTPTFEEAECLLRLIIILNLNNNIELLSYIDNSLESCL